MTKRGAHGQNASISSATNIAGPNNKILAQATGQNIRYTVDGTTPTASLGFVLYAGDGPSLIPVPKDGQLKVIEETAGATIEYQALNPAG